MFFYHTVLSSGFTVPSTVTSIDAKAFEGATIDGQPFVQGARP